MKTVLFPFLLIALFLGTFLFRLNDKENTTSVIYEQQGIPFCGPASLGNIIKNGNGKFVVALPGWGQHAYKISTANDSAQFYFNQGLSMYYSYHMKEALASFKESSRFDPEHPMPYWGQALAMGPYYNAAHTYVMPATIHPVLKHMNETASHASESEKSLIKVMNSRYSDDVSDSKRKSLNIAYAGEMKSLISEYPSDLEIKALYVDAIMLIHAWDFWNTDGTPKPWTEEVVSLSENILTKNPDHIAALHYHIHLTEASHHPEVALPNADKLKNLLPGVAHMVHMASHEYQRNGLYAKGVEVNDLADNNLLHYDSLAPNLALNKHSPHYFAVQTYCAISGGMYKTGMQAALRCRRSVSPTAESTYDQYLYMLPELTLVRLGKWQEILKNDITPDTKWTYAGLLSDFTKGMAYVNTGQMDKAKKHLAALREKSKDPVLEKRRIPFNAPLPMAHIAEEILNASVLFAEKKNDAAISSLNKAIEIEDGLIYTEPNDWPIPARQFLGAFLLKMNKPALAEKVYKEDLIWNPANGWSLIGLSQSLKAQKKNDKLAEYKSKYLMSFSKADVIPPASVYLK